MLVTLLYHRAIPGRYGNCATHLDRHFSYLAKHYPIKLPFQKLEKNRLNICLSFDDATCDFYATIYPLLKKHGLRALLAVPAGYIADNTELPIRERLSLLENFSFQNSPAKEAFCSFEELKEMLASGHILVASHGMHHKNLSESDIDLNEELVDSKSLLETKLNRQIDTFVFPYGRYHSLALKEALKHYKLAMRIGSALNFSWDSSLHYRVNADQVENLSSLFTLRKIFGYASKRLLKFF